MPDFSLRNISDEPEEPEEPSGEYDYIFYNPKTDEEKVVPADSPNEAWEGIHYYKGVDWWKWILQGREGVDMTMVSVEYANAHKDKVEGWAEEGEE